MYSGIEDRIINFVRFGCAFTIVFVLWPYFLFKNEGEAGLDGLISRYVKMVCLIIAVVYLLLIIKLYELLSLVAVLVALSAYKKLGRDDLRGNIQKYRIKTVSWLYDLFDGLVHPLALIKKWCLEQALSLKRSIFCRVSGVIPAVNVLLFTAVFLYSAYLRFYDAFMHAAPGMSDAYVTLAWMKYIEQKILFHDGIYPQGFHIYLSVLHKFAANDPLYVLKDAGPLNGVLITLGIYFVVSRFTGRVLPGIVSSFVYGVLGSYLPIGWERQASTNSQEFALVFLLPACYYAATYIKSLKKSDFWAAVASFVVIGLVHTLVFIFLGVGLFLLFLVNLILKFRETLKPVAHLCLAGFAAGVVSTLPAVIGLLMGRQFNSSSAEFATAKLVVNFPEVTLIDKVALVGFFFLIVSVFLKRSRKDPAAEIFIFIFGLASFAIYMFLGPYTGNAVLATRTGILWGLLASIGAGLGWNAIYCFRPGNGRVQKAEILLCIILMAAALAYLKPVPAIPYKMQYDSVVDQYLRISNQFRPSQWVIVSSREGYDLALGRGWHIHLGDFLNWYNPGDTYLTRVVDGHEELLKTPDIFIFKEKKLFQVDMEEMKPILAQRQQEYQMLDQWLQKYRATHNNISIYYEDQDIQVIHIHYDRTRQEITRDIWGNGDDRSLFNFFEDRFVLEKKREAGLD